MEMVHKRFPLQGWIGLESKPASGETSGFRFMKPEADAIDLPFIGVSTYNLSAPADKESLLSLDVDLLLILGWQRLIPTWLIDHCKVAALGGHGSSRGITGGRGRSPQNWALLLGHSTFEIALFKVDPGIDSGAVLDARTFPLTERDDIRSSYYKSSFLLADMIIDSIEGEKFTSGKSRPQEGVPAYLPQRTPEDGEIDWRRNVLQIDRFVRALSKPYPGAFSCTDGTKITIWRGRPFSSDSQGALPGEVLKLLSAGALVATGDGLFLIDEFETEGPGCLREGAVLKSADFPAQIAGIVKRHQAKYPELPVSEDIICLASESPDDNLLEDDF